MALSIVSSIGQQADETGEPHLAVFMFVNMFYSSRFNLINTVLKYQLIAKLFCKNHKWPKVAA